MNNFAYNHWNMSPECTPEHVLNTFKSNLQNKKLQKESLHWYGIQRVSFSQTAFF